MEPENKPSPPPTDFDRFARNYRAVHDVNLKPSGFPSDYFAAQKARILVAEAPAPDAGSPLRLLDVGCGTGRLEALILAARGGSAGIQMEGIDVSAQSVEEAQSQQLPGAAFRVYDGQHVPFGADSFDVIVFCCVMHHVPLAIREPLLKECRRALKPGGALFIFEHNPLNPLTQYLVKSCPFDGDAILLRSGQAADLLRRAGFRVVAKSFINFFPNRGVFQKLMPLENRLRRLPLGAQYYLRAARAD